MFRDDAVDVWSYTADDVFDHFSLFQTRDCCEDRTKNRILCASDKISAFTRIYSLDKFPEKDLSVDG